MIEHPTSSLVSFAEVHRMAVPSSRASFGHPPRLPRALVGLALALLAAGGCIKRGRAKYAPREVAKVLNVEKASLQPAIAARIAGSDRPSWVTPERWQRVSALYAAYENAPLWLEEGGVKDRATALLDAIRRAPEDGLDTGAYPLDALQRVVDAGRITDTASASTIADADVLLTSAYVAYASDMLMGQVSPQKVSQNWHTGTGTAERDSAVVHALEEGDMADALKQMAPQDPDYAALKAAYARYRKIAESGGWPVVAATSGAAGLEAVRARLAAEETASDSGAAPLPAGADSSPVATETQVAHRKSAVAPEILRFQNHHGLEPTGRLDAATLTALNIPADARARQIAANLERHRWLPRTLGSRFIYVNVPSFRLDAYDSGQKTLSMKVVVGAEYQGKATPAFSDSMETVVFRPYWNITPDIQAKEIGPKVAADRGYLERENMEYYKDGGATRIRQRPGGKNSLGLVKFLFPNDFNIYLHDTPAKTLFAKTDRAASHGCIRLEKPAELAQWVLGWDAARVDQAMNGGQDNHPVALPRKIPVYIVYFTAYLRDGQLYFGDDLYGRDDALEQQMTTRSLAAAE
jgi:murein L,D-transpeptidase YcbB/YkuD